MTQARVGVLVGRSGSWVSRVEAGRVRSVSVLEMMVVAAAVGLKLAMNAFPAGRRLLDAPQLGLLAGFDRRLHPSWERRTEAVMPLPGDLRAIDLLISIPGCACAVEAMTRLGEVHGTVRAARAKQRDIGADRLILLVRGTHANRRAIREAGQLLAGAFPIGSREALRCLSEGRDPGGDCLILL